MTRYSVFILIYLLSFLNAQAQNREVELSESQIEELFMANNLELLAEKFNITIADAAVIQAKLWENPTFSINDLNFWSSASKRDGETIPPLFGSFGKNTQFSVELSQIVSLSRKRAKLVKAEKVSREMAMMQFEQMLRALKLELRQITGNLSCLQSSFELLSAQKSVMTEIIVACEKQHEKGFLSAAELVRIKLALFELETESNELQIELNAAQRELKNLLSCSDSLYIRVAGEEYSLPQPDQINLIELINLASDNRMELILARLETNYQQRNMSYEKAVRVPDLNLSVGYDRRGGVWPSFVGIGLGIDIPVFNRNQGAVKAAKAAVQQSEVLARQQEIEVGNEVTEAYMNYTQLYQFNENNLRNMESFNLTELSEAYNKNLMNRNISLMEYMDFMETCMNIRRIELNSRRDLLLQWEELKYAVGTDKITVE